MKNDRTFTFSHVLREQDYRPTLKVPMVVTRRFDVPTTIRCDDISVVVPVKNNQVGIDRLLGSMRTVLAPGTHPREVIIVDNGSDELTSVKVDCPFPVQVLQCMKRGPGAARNVGAAQASGQWILFTDSDCIATPSFVAAYETDDNVAVGYAGGVDTKIVDQCTLFYQEQGTFIPRALSAERGVVPSSLVTANCLVLKEAILAVGGFNERFVYAGGEDGDLGFRLRMVGPLQFNLYSEIAHEITDGLPGFSERFMRYGRGQRLLELHYDAPGGFRPWRVGPLKNPTRANRFLAEVAYHSMCWGYLTERSPEYLTLAPEVQRPSVVDGSRGPRGTDL